MKKIAYAVTFLDTSLVHSTTTCATVIVHAFNEYEACILAQAARIAAGLSYDVVKVIAGIE